MSVISSEVQGKEKLLSLALLIAKKEAHPAAPQDWWVTYSLILLLPAGNELSQLLSQLYEV